MLSSSKTIVFLLGLFVVHVSQSSEMSASAFVPINYRRRGARGKSSSSRTSPDSPVSVALTMAPKKAAKKAKKAEKVAEIETLRKKDVVETVSEQLGISKRDAEAAVTTVFDVISDVSHVLVCAPPADWCFVTDWPVTIVFILGRGPGQSSQFIRFWHFWTEGKGG